MHAECKRISLRKLLADIAGDKIDAALVYKIDRLSRSLLDNQIHARAEQAAEGVGRQRFSIVCCTTPTPSTSKARATG